MVKKGFADLSDIDPERFDFQVYNARQNWVIVLDEVWELLSRDPPMVWIITIRAGPEEREQREYLPEQYTGTS
jgi:hypothetical protein